MKTYVSFKVLDKHTSKCLFERVVSECILSDYSFGSVIASLHLLFSDSIVVVESALPKRV